MPARIVLAWELGHGYGHALPLVTLARKLLERGDQVTLVTRDPVKLRQVLGGLDVAIYCAPFFPAVMLPAQQQNSLADVIWFDAGGAEAAVLTELMLAWRRLLGLLHADLLIADAAPVALAAAQGLVPTLAYDNGFHSTDTGAWAIFRDWEPIQARASAERALRLVQHLNTARAAAALPAVDTLAQGFAASAYCLRMPAELDYVAERPQVRHVGQTPGPGDAPDWSPERPQYRLFAYLRRAWPLTERVLAGLARLQHTEVLCFHDGIAPAQRRSAAHLRYTERTLDLAQVLPAVDAVICHGGGLQALALQYGKPTLALPLHTEQYLWARQAERQGCGLAYLARAERPDFLPMIRALLTQPTLAARASELSGAHAARVPDASVATLAEVDRLLAR